MTIDEILERMTLLIKEYTIPVERVIVAGQPSEYSWNNMDAEIEFKDLYELLKSRNVHLYV